MAEKTTTGRLVAAIGGIVLIISLFLNWYGADFDGIGGEFGAAAGQFAESLNVDTSFSGWQSLDFGDIVFFVIGVLAIAPAAFDIFDLEIELPFDIGLVALVGGGISVLWIIWRFIDKPDGISVEFGLFVGLLGAALVAAGGFLQKGDDEGEEYAYAAPGQPIPPQAPPVAAPPPAAPPAAAPPVAPPPAQPQAPQQPPQPPQQPPQPPQ